MGWQEADIDAKATDSDYVSVQMMVGEANNEYVMLISSNCWEHSGELHECHAPEGLVFTKAEVNTLV